MKLSQLPVGALVKDPNTKYNNDVIIWQVLEHGHTGDPSGSTTLQSRDILTLKCFDAKEPSNSNSVRKQYGNNRYKYSNILQWLNSDKNSWYEAQHTYDQAPESSYVTVNAYASEAGFLTNLSDKLKKALMTVSKTTVLSSTDGGGSETVESKVFLTSTTEVGLANENNIAEGSIYSLYNTASYRIKNLFNEAAKGDYSSATSPSKWWLRTPNDSNSYGYEIWCVNDEGTRSRSYGSSYGMYGIVPALCISSDTEVSDTPDASNVYTLQFAPSCVKAYIGDENGEAKLIWEQEHEIEALVPVMTSNTTPSGVASSKSNISMYDPYIAFDGRLNASYRSNGTGAGEYIQYQFTNPVVIKKLALLNNDTTSGSQQGVFDLQGSNDGTTFTNIKTNIIESVGTELEYFDINSSIPYLYVRLTTVTANRTDGRTNFIVVQYYGYKA